MTHDPYQPPSNADSSVNYGEVPPYQQGPNGVPPYQAAGNMPPYNAEPFGQPDAGSYSQQGAGPFGQQQPYGQQGQYPPYAAGPVGAMAPGEERTWSILAHVAGVAGALLSVGWLGFLGPLVIYLVFKDRSARIRAAAAGAFNFQVTLLIVNVVAFIFAITVIGLVVAVPLWIAGVIALFVCHIMAAVRAANDEPYSYPGQIPILK